MGKRWFHKEDGGLMVEDTIFLPLYDDGKNPQEIKVRFGYVCAMCGYKNRDPEWGQNCIHFSDLPENLQAAALGEML